MKYRVKAGALGAAAALALLSVMPLSVAQSSGSSVLNQISNQLGTQFSAKQDLAPDRAENLLGRPIMNAQGQRAGKLDNLVVDLDSGRLLFAIVTFGGMLTRETIAVPSAVLSTAGVDSNLVFTADNSSLTNAPRWKSSEKAAIGNVSFVNQVYQHFGMKPWWAAGAKLLGKESFTNADLARDLVGSTVRTAAGDASLGTIKDLVIDVPSGWAIFAVIAPKASLTGRTELYPIPPESLSKSLDGKLVAASGLDPAKLEGGPHFVSDSWPNLSDRSYQQQVYQYYGQHPGFLGKVLPPTGR